MKTLVVIKAGIGRDLYDWSCEIKFDHGVLLVYGEDEQLLHAYSPGAWLEIDVIPEPAQSR
jgi:hypothetical protein